MKFLLTLIIIILLTGYLTPRLLPWLMRLWIKRVQKKFHQDDTPRPKKRIDRSQGDYIDFEEIE